MFQVIEDGKIEALKYIKDIKYEIICPMDYDKKAKELYKKLTEKDGNKNE